MEYDKSQFLNCRSMILPCYLQDGKWNKLLHRSNNECNFQYVCLIIDFEWSIQYLHLSAKFRHKHRYSRTYPYAFDCDNSSNIVDEKTQEVGFFEWKFCVQRPLHKYSIQSYQLNIQKYDFNDYGALLLTCNILFVFILYWWIDIWILALRTLWNFNN